MLFEASGKKIPLSFIAGELACFFEKLC